MARRRRWSDEERCALLAAHEESGLGVKAFADAAGVPCATLAYWRARRARENAPRLVPVDVVHEHAATIEVAVGGAVVRVGTDFDDALLVRVVRALRTC